MGGEGTQAQTERLATAANRDARPSAHGFLDAIARRADLALAAGIALLLLTPDSTYFVFRQLDVVRVAVLIPAIPLLLAARRSALRLAATDIALGAFLTVALIGWALGTDADNPRLLVAILLPFAFYLWGRIAGRRAIVTTVLWALTICSAIGALTVLYEYVFAGRPLFVDEASYYWNPVNGLLFRPGGLYGSPPGAALIFSMTAFAATHLALTSSGWPRRLAALCLVVLVAALMVTFARGSYVGFALGAVVYLALTLPRPMLRRSLLVVAGALALFAISIPFWVNSDIFQEGLLRPSTFDYRLGNWELALDAVSSSPDTLIRGHGFNSLLLARPEYGSIPAGPDLSLQSLLVTDGPHNQYLLTLIETGIIGLVALVAWLTAAIGGGVRAALAASHRERRLLLAALSAAVLAYAVACLFGDHLRYDTGVAVVALFAGMLTSVATSKRSRSSSRAVAG